MRILHEIVQQIGYRILPRLFLKHTGGPVNLTVEEAVRSYESIGWIEVMMNPERFLLVSLRLLNISEYSGFSYGIALGSTALGIMIDFIPIFWLAEGYHRRAMAFAEQIQQPDALSLAYSGLALHKWCLGESDLAIEYEQQAAETCRETGDLHGWGYATNLLAVALYYRGNLTQSLIYCRDIVRLGQEGADSQVQCWGLSTQGAGLRRLGQLDEAITVLREAVALAKAIPDYSIQIAADGDLGRCYLHQGELKQALSVLQRSQQVYVEYGTGWGANTPFCNGLAEAYLLAAEQRDKTERANWLKKARRACKDALKLGKAFRPALPEAMRLQGTYEWLKGKPGVAQNWWQRSLALAEEMGQRYDLGMTYLEMGQRLKERIHLERAEAILVDIGAKWDLARAQEALRDLKVT